MIALTLLDDPKFGEAGYTVKCARDDITKPHGVYLAYAVVVQCTVSRTNFKR